MDLPANKCCAEGTGEHKRLKELSEGLRIIADENRLQILCLLKQGERCVCNIYEPLGLPQNLASHHLKALRDAGFVNARRQGKWVYYSLNVEKIELLTLLYSEVVLGGKDGDKSAWHGMHELQEASGECS